MGNALEVETLSVCYCNYRLTSEEELKDIINMSKLKSQWSTLEVYKIRKVFHKALTCGE